MRISVALCTYNGGRFLPRQLASVAAQARPPDEVVACDDGSTDATIDLLRDFASRMPFPVRVLRNERNLGSTKNFERAIGLCEGDVIALADQDDRWLPHKLSAIAGVFAASPDLGMVFSNATLIGEHDRPIGTNLWDSVRFGPAREREIRGGHAFGELLKRPCVTGAATAFRAHHRDVFSPIPADWVHDEWIALLIAATARILPIREPLMEYRRHSRNQVGITGTTIRERSARSLARPFAEYGARSEAFGKLRARIAEEVPGPEEFLLLLDGKIRHFRTRADLPESRWSRVPTVLRELVSGRYARYSGTAIGSIRDLVAGR